MFPRVFLILFTFVFTFTVLAHKKSYPDGQLENYPQINKPVTYLTLLHSDDPMATSVGKSSGFVFFVSENIAMIPPHYLLSFKIAVDFRFHQFIFAEAKPKQFHLLI